MSRNERFFSLRNDGGLLNTWQVGAAMKYNYWGSASPKCVSCHANKPKSDDRQSNQITTGNSSTVMRMSCFRGNCYYVLRTLTFLYLSINTALIKTWRFGLRNNNSHLCNNMPRQIIREQSLLEDETVGVSSRATTTTMMIMMLILIYKNDMLQQ